jgi:uncharacterized membrane protein
MPNAAYLHLLLNHFPIIVNLCAVGVLIIGMFWKSDSVQRVALLLFIVTALFTLATDQTGDGAAALVKNLQGVDKSAIKPHDEAAGWAVGVLGAGGLAALAGWIAFRSPKVFPSWFLIAILLLGLLGTATVTRVALLGGRIHHPEDAMKSP